MFKYEIGEEYKTLPNLIPFETFKKDCPSLNPDMNICCFNRVGCCVKYCVAYHFYKISQKQSLTKE